MSGGGGTKIDSLFYELELRAESWEQGLETARTAGKKFTDFVTAHPIAVAGLLATAFVAVGLHAAQMAGEVDTAVRKIGASLPEATARMEDLKGTARDLSVEFGISQVEVVKNMETIAKGGVDSVDDLIAASRAATLAVEATGASFESVAGSLDSSLDVFGLSAKDSEAILAKLFVTAQGKGTIEELSQGFGRLAIKLQEAGVDFETATDATATLIGKGASAKTAVAELGDILEKKGAAGLKALAAESHVASDGLREMGEQARLNGTSVEAMHRRVKESLNAALIDLGTSILPIVLKEMQGLVGLIDLFNGSVDRIQATSALATVNSLAGALKSLKGEMPDEAFERFEIALSKAAGGTGNLRNSVGALASGFALVGRLGPENLRAVESGLAALAASGRLSQSQLETVGQALGNVRAEIDKRGLTMPTLVPPGTAGDLAGASAGVGVLTAAQRAAVIASKDLDQEQKNAILSAKALSDTMKDQVAKAMKEAGDRAKDLAEKYAAGMKKVQDTLAKATVTLVDDTKLAMGALAEELESSGIAAGEVEDALRPMNEQLALIKVNEKFDLPEILERSARALTDRDVARLKDAEGELRDLYKTTVAGTTAHKDVAEKLAVVQEKIAEHAKATKDAAFAKDMAEDFAAAVAEAKRLNIELPEIPKPLGEGSKKTQEMVERIAAVAQGALGAATAFGVMKDETANVLANVINIGTNIGRALGGDPLAIAGVLGSLGGVLEGLFGDTAEGRAKKQLLKENNAALRELTEEFGDFGSLKSSGRTFAETQRVLGKELGSSGLGANGINALLFGTSGIGGLAGVPGIIEQLKNAGVSMKDVEALAKELGITLRNSKTGAFELAGFQALFDALGKTEFTEFARTFKGQMDRIKLELETGVLDPTEEFGAVLDVVKDAKIGSPAIARALEGIDTSTAEGRRAAADRLRALVSNLASLSPGDLGLSQGDFTDTINRLLEILTSDRGIGPSPGTPTPDRPPVPDAGGGPSGPTTQPPIGGVIGHVGADLPPGEVANWDRSLDQGATQIDLLAQLVALTNRLLPLQPPPLPDGFGGVRAAGVRGGLNLQGATFHLYVTVPGTAPDPVAFARASLEALQRELSFQAGVESGITGGGLRV